MNEPKIEIFAPFETAVDLTKRILFQPFDLMKWLTIGFCAFLAGLGDGSHGGGSFNPGNWNSPGKTANQDLARLREQIPNWFTLNVIIFVMLIFVALVILCAWLGSRGRFMFIDCIVRNRGAIAEPWREYRQDGNRLFLFKMAAAFVALCLWAIIALPWIIPYWLHGELPRFDAIRILFLIGVALLFIPLSILWAATLWFMVPVMYRQRVGPVAACTQVLGLMASYPWPFLLYVLFVFVLILAGMIAGCVVTCVTCCVAAIPYVGTVVLLPLYVFYYSYTLLFLRQFGPGYDVWGNAGTPLPTPEPPPLP